MITHSRHTARGVCVLSLMAGLTATACKDSTGPDPGPDGQTPGISTILSPSATVTLSGGSSGTENVLVIVDTGLASGTAKFNYSVTATGIGAAGAVSAPSTALLPSSGVSAAAAAGTGPVLDIGFGMRLNERSRSRLRGGFDAARSAYAARTTTPNGVSRSLGSVVPQVGDILNVNVSMDACSNPEVRQARVVAIGTQSIVLSDTQNPAGGFTTTDFLRFAARFDTLVYPLDVANFGTPADIDQNGKIVLLFTSAVNAMTPRGSTSYVAGFFYNRDLFPTTAKLPDFPQGCAGSNYSELFYLLVPDPAGLVSTARTTGFVDSITTSVIAHEFQHLINASRRLYVTTNAEDFEVAWLNEGLSHIAEELLFYREAALSPRQNLDSIALRSSNKIRTAFNMNMSSNASRYRSFLEKPSENSPVRPDDSLETRGATWALLRYLADRKGGAEATTWQALVNSPKVGLPNMTTVFGSDIASRVRDWNVSHYTDDVVVSNPIEYSQPSWNWRSIYKALAPSGPAFPLEVKTFSGGTASGTLIGGGAAYYRFSIPANGSATISLTAPTAFDARVVRIR